VRVVLLNAQRRLFVLWVVLIKVQTIVPGRSSFWFSEVRLHAGRKIANKPWRRHLWAALLLTLPALPNPGQAQSKYQPIELSDRDVREVVEFYKTDNPAASVAALRSRMPAEIKDAHFRDSIHRGLPPDFISRTIHNDSLNEALRRFLSPVLSLYGRSQAYDLIVIDSDTPIMMSDSGVVLVVSTGMIRAATSDDELLGYAAHEVAHEFFASYSIYSTHILRLVADKGKEPILNRHMTEILAIIELQCDAFASLTLAYLGYNTREFANGLDRIRAHYPNAPFGNHPADSVRRSVIEGIVTAALNNKPRVSQSLRLLNALILDPAGQRERP
jgi:hypothetical protein